jgi:DNA-binding transcriptional regulator YiaG
VERRSTVHQFQSTDINRLCKVLNCSRAQLAGRLGVTRACVSQWEKGKRIPQQADAERLRQLLGEPVGNAVNVFELRQKLGMTQRVFGAQFGVSRQQVQKWESGKAIPHRSQLDRLVKLAGAAVTVRAPLVISDPEMLTVSGAAAYSSITEKTIRKALKHGRLAYTVDTSPGPWPRQGRFLIRRSDLEGFKRNTYDPYFKKGRWVRAGHEQKLTMGSVLAFTGSDAVDRTEGD